MTNYPNNMRIIGLKLLIATIIVPLSSISFASANLDDANLNDIIGSWKNIDDKTGKAKSIIQITENNGIYSGKIVKLLNPSTPDPVCEKCKGEDANKPIVGLTIIKDTQKKENSWGGGTILDPKKGKIYKVKFTLIEEGKKLKVRGFVGVPTLGRTQIWLRQ